MIAIRAMTQSLTEVTRDIFNMIRLVIIIVPLVCGVEGNISLRTCKALLAGYATPPSPWG